MDREVESAISQLTGAVVRRKKYPAFIVEAPHDCNLPTCRSATIAGQSYSRDVGTVAHFAVEDHLVCSYREVDLAGSDRAAPAHQSSIGVHDGEERARPAGTQELSRLGVAGVHFPGVHFSGRSAHVEIF